MKTIRLRQRDAKLDPASPALLARCE